MAATIDRPATTGDRERRVRPAIRRPDRQTDRRRQLQSRQDVLPRQAHLQRRAPRRSPARPLPWFQRRSLPRRGDVWRPPTSRNRAILSVTTAIARAAVSASTSSRCSLPGSTSRRSFDVRPPIADLLANKSREELVALIEAMLAADPESRTAHRAAAADRDHAGRDPSRRGRDPPPHRWRASRSRRVRRVRRRLWPVRSLRVQLRLRRIR